MNNKKVSVNSLYIKVVVSPFDTENVYEVDTVFEVKDFKPGWWNETYVKNSMGLMVDVITEMRKASEEKHQKVDPPVIQLIKE